jgi:hypothetical protein
VTSKLWLFQAQATRKWSNSLENMTTLLVARRLKNAVIDLLIRG